MDKTKSKGLEKVMFILSILYFINVPVVTYYMANDWNIILATLFFVVNIFNLHYFVRDFKKSYSIK